MPEPDRGARSAVALTNNRRSNHDHQFVIFSTLIVVHHGLIKERN